VLKKLNLVLLCSILLLSQSCIKPDQTINTPQNIHAAHLNDWWYPQNQDTLNQQLNDYFYLTQQNFDVVVDPNSIKALIVPHAGSYYSGLCAASAYQTLFKNKKNFEKNNKIKKVIILSPSHVKSIRGIALPDYDVYQTTFGKINVDKNAIEILKRHNLFNIDEQAHNTEHAIEIQLPFLQKTIEYFNIVPLVIGHLENNEYFLISDALKKIIDDQTLIVVSSDFVHHGSNYNYKLFDNHILKFIKFIDSAAIETITRQSFDLFNTALQNSGATICGQNAIKILLKLLEKNVLGSTESRLSCYYTSPQREHAYYINDLLNEVSDDKCQTSVSYAGLIFTTKKPESLNLKDQLTQFEKKSLLNLARQTIKNAFALNPIWVTDHLLWPIKSEGLQRLAGAFVTLNTKDGKLRGCIGKIIPDAPLYQIVQGMSKAAAFTDDRFEPLEEKELDNIGIDITILTPPKQIKSIEDIEIGKHGIILKKTIKSGNKLTSVFLPQVPPSLKWNLQTTLEQLSIKAGLEKDAWQQDCEFEVFEGFEIHE
jgi:MEMO1 family protein